MPEKIKGFMQLNTGAAAAFAIGKAVLALSKDEALDQVTASVTCPGAAHIEVKYGTATGVYGDPVRVENSTYSWITEDESVFVVARGIACDGTAGAWSDEATITLNVNNFLTFAFPGQVGASVINTVAGTIAVTVPHGTNPAALVATFTLSAGASASVGETPQVSGVTANDFTLPVVYTVVGADAAEQAWTVSVTIAV